MTIFFQGGQTMPALGTPEYEALQKQSQASSQMVQGNYDPKTKIVSSSSYSDQNNTDSSLIAAGSPSIKTQQTIDPLKEWMQTLQTNTNNRLNTEKDIAQKTQAALDISFDAQLASQNQMYGSAITQIRQQADNAKQVATSNAVALNPYSQSKGAQTSANFQNAVTAKYQMLENDIREKAIAAENLSRAGYAEKSLQIQREISKSIADAQSDINQALYQFTSLSQNQNQFNISQSNTMGRAAQDDFQTYLNTLSGSTALQADIESYERSGKITPGLAPIIEKGGQIGLSPDEALSIFKYQTDKVRQQQATEEYRQQQLINATDRQTVAQMKIASMNAVTQAGTLLASQGIKPGTMEYAKGIAQATGASPTGLTATESSTYATIANIGDQLVGLKDTLDSLKDDNDIKNMLFTKGGSSIQSLTSPQLALLTSKINALVAPVSRVMFGERGVLTEPDVARSLSTLPSGATTAQVRDVLFKEILSKAKNGAINKLSVDASSGRNVQGMVPYVEKLVGDIDSVLSSYETKTDTGGKNTYTDPKTGKTYTY